MPELLPYDFEDADVTVIIGKVPDKLQGEKTIKRAFSLISDNEYTLEIKDTAHYYAGFGNTVIVEPNEGADENSIRLFLLGTIMAAILYQRGNIPLHSSAIIKDNKLVLFTGNSGAGKSTLLAALVMRGYTAFTDDICVINHDRSKNTIEGMASYPMIKLWEDSLLKLDNESFTRDFKIRPHLPKYGHFFHDTFSTQSLPVSKVFIMGANNATPEIEYNQLNTLQAFKRVEKQAYRYRFATGESLRQVHFSLMTALTRQVPVIETKRPISGTTVDQFADIIEGLL